MDNNIDGTSKPTDNCTAIDGIVHEIDSFLIDWVDRFRVYADQLQPFAEQAQSQIRKLEQERSDWEFQRDAEQTRLEQFAERLTSAWLQLEDEQRAAMANFNSPALVHPNAPSAIGPAALDQPATEIRAEVLPVPEDTVSPSTPSLAVNARVALPSNGVPRDVAVRQFKQLKNEIQSNRL